MLAPRIITDSKGSFLDAKNSRIIYKNDLGNLSPLLCSWEAGLPHYTVISLITLILYVLSCTVGLYGAVKLAKPWLQAAFGLTGPNP